MLSRKQRRQSSVKMSTVSAQEAVSLREAAERRSQFARVPARSVSAPPRKKWFRSKQQLSGVTDGMDGSSRAGSQEIVCDEFTKKLVAAITTWHDIHSSLLQLSIELFFLQKDLRMIQTKMTMYRFPLNRLGLQHQDLILKMMEMEEKNAQAPIYLLQPHVSQSQIQI
uniref:NR LBD domain-containing protein n=1 Tax=Caenorhabditis tropicalis TaxID=1561998 RepID=A0A1I7TTB4_9PELO